LNSYLEIMMKKILLSLINLYKISPLGCHNNCKFIPSCSDYAKEAINIYGSFKGSLLSIRRILRCNPFNKGGLDPVPKRHE